MYKSRTLLAVGILVLAAGAASARSVQVGQVPGVGSGSAGSSAGVGMYSPPGVGNLINNVSIVSAPVVQNAASIAGATGNGNNINAQTNIDVSKTVDTTSNIDVTETINGSNVAYGFSGANALNVIDSASDFDSGVSSNGGAAASAAVADALLAAELGD
jgi:hypothetical protein